MFCQTSIQTSLAQIRSIFLKCIRQLLGLLGNAAPTLATLSQDLARTLCHSRWLTTANRILQLYIWKENPDKRLVTLVNYIVKVYATKWFEINSKPSCTGGSRHLFHMIHYSRYMYLSTE